jgi:predicted RNA-binding Zn-ribbon protein involved in translation (DUF1610 family)
MAIQKFKSMIKRNEGGVLSDGTLNLQHLLAKAYDLINNGNFEGKEKLLDEIWGLYKFENDIDDSKCDLYRYQFIGWAELKEDEKSQNIANEIWHEDLFNFFNEISPEGYAFGSSEGDGALFGWFKIEEEGEEEMGEENKNLCPRCKENELHEDMVMNSLSRKDNETYICDDCGTEEAMEEMGF